MLEFYIYRTWAMVNFPNLSYRPRPMFGNPRQTWILDFTSCGSGFIAI